MSVAVQHVDADTAIVTVTVDPLGRVAEQVHDSIGGLLDDGTCRVVVEFRGADLLNSKVLDALVRATARQDPSRGGIAVVTGQDYVRQLLEISETGGVVLLAETRSEALDALPHAP